MDRFVLILIDSPDYCRESQEDWLRVRKLVRAIVRRGGGRGGGGVRGDFETILFVSACTITLDMVSPEIIPSLEFLPSWMAGSIVFCSCLFVLSQPIYLLHRQIAMCVFCVYMRLGASRWIDLSFLGG